MNNHMNRAEFVNLPYGEYTAVIRGEQGLLICEKGIASSKQYFFKTISKKYEINYIMLKTIYSDFLLLLESSSAFSIKYHEITLLEKPSSYEKIIYWFSKKSINQQKELK